jgi:hypothetical protein
MLQNTPNNHFGSNGVEWMFWLRNHICNLGTQNSAFRPETQVLHLLHSEGIENAEKHSQSSFWVQWS